MQPEGSSTLTTSLPKGHIANKPSFIVCIPNGIPIMLIKRTKLAAKYSIAMARPPKMSQTRFPINLMFQSVNFL